MLKKLQTVANRLRLIINMEKEIGFPENWDEILEETELKPLSGYSHIFECPVTFEFEVK